MHLKNKKGKIYASLLNFLEGKKCTPFIAPLDVALSKSKQDHKIFNVVQPDVMVVCDGSKLEDGKKVFGAPDFVVEILSPSTSRKDQLEKLNLYLKYKVKEYWIIDPENMWAWPYILNDQGIYELERVYDLSQEEVPIKILKGYKINLIKENKEWLKIEDTKLTQDK
ncbi:MAG: Uma2 family endonuclease [Clostridia bacterium]|nr:Uma2 family endonuclease [Clostridia bacterium]